MRTEGQWGDEPGSDGWVEGGGGVPSAVGPEPAVDRTGDGQVDGRDQAGVCGQSEDKVSQILSLLRVNEMKASHCHVQENRTNKTTVFYGTELIR